MDVAVVSLPLAWIASGSTAADICATSSADASAVTSTTRGRRSVAAIERTREASSPASVDPSARGVPGTTFRPMASAPAAIAAATPSRSVTPQIFTKGLRATLAGSPGGRPAATNERTAAAGSAARINASPTSAPSNPRARQRATVDGSRTPDSAMTMRSSGTSGRRRSARSTSTSRVRRSRLLIPITRASDSSASSSSRRSWASTRGSRPRLIAAETSSRRRRLVGCRTTRMSTASAPAARSESNCLGSTTNSFASTGTLTAARTRRTSSTDPPNQCGSQSTEIAAAPPAAYARACATMSSRSFAICPAEGDERLTSAIRCRPGEVKGTMKDRGSGPPAAPTFVPAGLAANSAARSSRRRAAISSTTFGRDDVPAPARGSATVMPAPGLRTARCRRSRLSRPRPPSALRAADRGARRSARRRW